ncbi:WYL domain-containing protein [Paenibacillus sp. CC-CFT747]|nr:WYL domain-containing protein [Paenibacillus sp. CC-CFT747]
MTLLIGADFVKGRLDEEYGARARSSQEKIEAILPENVREETARVRSAIRLLKEREAGTRGQEKETFKQLRQAILKKSRVRFRYSKGLSAPDEMRHSERVADPYGLAYSQGAWVLVAFCQLRGTFGTFGSPV